MCRSLFYFVFRIRLIHVLLRSLECAMVTKKRTINLDITVHNLLIPAFCHLNGTKRFLEENYCRGSRIMTIVNYRLVGFRFFKYFILQE